MAAPLRTLPFFVASAALLACSPGIEAPDAGADAADAGHAASTLFGPCLEDYQCPGAGAFCRKAATGFPGGICTKRCEDRTPCDAFGSWNYCLREEGTELKVCAQKCLNGIDCGREGYTCSDPLVGGVGVCEPVCSGDLCGAGAECNADSGRCVAPGSVPAGAGLGEGCDADEDCVSGSCTPETVGTTPTGYVGGICTGPCILPAGWNNNTIFSGDVLRPGSCPAGNICVPSGSLARGDPGQCVPECRSDGDCRTGYECLQTVGLSDGSTKTFDNGWCTPLDCTRTDCPSGYLCKPGSGRYVCTKA